MPRPTLARAGVAAGVLSLCAAVVPALGPIAGPAGASTPLRCSATATSAHPTRNSTVTVAVRTSAYAAITTTAHYKTTNTTHTGKASSRGAAAIAYRISRATPGYRVTVSVAVAPGRQRGACSTSFTPR